MAEAAGGALLAGGALSAFGSYQQGQATSQADLFNAAMAKQNAQLATEQANYTAKVGDQDVAAQELKNRAESGAITANQGASGISIGSGSFQDVAKSAHELGQLDAMTIRANAMRRAYGYQIQSASDIAQSNLDTMAAKNAKTAGEIGAVSGLLKTAGASNLNTGSSSSGDLFKGWQANQSPTFTG